MNFMHGQGYVIMNNIVYKYNKDSIRLEKMGGILVLET